MNPFEVTRDPDGGLPTVRVKRGYVVLTKEQDERAAERIAEILAENEKLRELLGKVLTEYKSDRKCFDCDPELCRRCAERNGIWDGCLFDKEIRGAARKLGVTAC